MRTTGTVRDRRDGRDRYDRHDRRDLQPVSSLREEYYSPPPSYSSRTGRRLARSKEANKASSGSQLRGLENSFDGMSIGGARNDTNFSAIDIDM